MQAAGRSKVPIGSERLVNWSWARASESSIGGRQPGLSGNYLGWHMSLQGLSDDGVAALYESIRQQVEADRHSKYRFAAGQLVRQRAEELRDELIRRRLHCPPISW